MFQDNPGRTNFAEEHIETGEGTQSYNYIFSKASDEKNWKSVGNERYLTISAVVLLV